MGFTEGAFPDMRVHRFAAATAIATFCLLIAGGLVSTTESGLACPDWPLCEGRYFPKMVDGKLFEHGHRLVAALVAVMTFTLSFLLWKRRDRMLRRLGVIASALVIVQALLGALTVKLRLPAWVSSTHQATAMAFFCLITSLAFLTRQRLMVAPRADHALDRRSRRQLGQMTGGLIGLTYLQMVAGALMRHTRAGLACGYDFPFCLGKVWPLEGHLGIQAHLVHRVGGIVVGAGVLALAFWVWRHAFANKALRFLSAAAAAGVLCQIGLGIAVIFTSRDLVTMTIHSSLGAALLADLVAMYWIGNPASSRGDPQLEADRAPRASLEPA